MQIFRNREALRQADDLADAKEGKVDAMDKTIWNYFDVEPKDPAAVRVIGADFGAGELAATYVDARQPLEEMLENLPGDNDRNRYIYTMYEDTRNEIGQKVLQLSDPDVMVYTNFKTTPENAKKIYGDRAGVRLEGKGAVSYQYLQQKTFYCFIRDVLRYNEHILTGSKEIYLFVGRPASNIWENQAKNYQEILKNGLSDLRTVKLADGRNVEVSFHIIVYSEAEAAMAYEYKKGNIDAKEAVLIIDGGSSTFDCVLVKDGRVVNEYSRQVGAGMIEQNLFDILLLGQGAVSFSFAQRRMERDKKMKTGSYDRTEGQLIGELRRRKESFYGPDGTNGRKDDGLTAFWNDKKVRIDLDNETMDIAVNKMPVRVERSYQDETDMFGGNLTQDYGSFGEAVEFFFKGAKDRCFDKKTGAPVKIDRIVFTGGATVMPFVQETAREVFETEKNKIEVERPSEDRHFSVSRGLAYMGYVELTKYHELKKIRERVCQKLESIRQSINSSIRGTCADRIWQECYIDQIARWTDDPSAETLNDWVKMPYQIPIDAVRENLGELLQKKELVKDINDILRENFQRLFPKESAAYAYQIQQDDILTAFSGQLPPIHLYLREILTTGQKLANKFSFINFLGLKRTEWDTVLTSEEKRKIRDRIKENKTVILADLRQKQVPQVTANAESCIYDTIMQNIDRSLEVYMESLTPYFVKGGKLDAANDGD